MRPIKLILLIAAIATFLPGCGIESGSPPSNRSFNQVDAAVDAQPYGDPCDPSALSECDRQRRAGIGYCQRLFTPGTCYEDVAAAYKQCTDAACAPHAATPDAEEAP